LFLLTDLIKRLEEENKVNVYLCQEKLPKVKSSLRLGKDKHSNCLFLQFSSKEGGKENMYLTLENIQKRLKSQRAQN